MTDNPGRAALAAIVDAAKNADHGHWFLEGNWAETSDNLGGWLATFYPSGSPLFELKPMCGSKNEIIANANYLVAARPANFRAIADYVADLEAANNTMRSALIKISSPTQSNNLLWWQMEARDALAD